MLVKLTSAIVGLILSYSSYAQNIDTCQIQFAVSTPPIALDQQVAFNVTNYQNVTKSVTLQGGSAPQFISELPCNDIPYVISATLYNLPSKSLLQPNPIGQCTLKAGHIILGSKDNSASVVFPQDFIC
ncbi:Uncharacterised protein [Legionella busanensis]|uniref:Protein with a bacterial immunoglobulin-like domain n=1 Tax=Legionella busanensis TaxID=190655 RepID=A0A378JL67_9GAMM|nr:hypothetical protein [Legionella busanensis]STX51975.1 Uncharacterised protein [Legionella busanensis]